MIRIYSGGMKAAAFEKKGRNLDESGGFWAKNGRKLDSSAEIA